MSEIAPTPKPAKLANFWLLVVVYTLTTASTVTAVQMMSPLLLELSTEFGTSLSVMGQIVTAGSVAWAFASPFAGLLSDRIGRKPLIVLGLLCFGLFIIASSFAANLPLLFATRMLGCLCGAFITTNMLAGTAEYFPADRRARALGWILTGYSLSAMVGVPALAYVASIAGWRWSFGIMGIAMMLMGLVLLTVLPVTSAQGASGLGETFGRLLRSKWVVGLLVPVIFERMLFNGIMTYMVAFLMQTHALTMASVAPVISVIALAALPGTVLGGRLAERWKPALAFGSSELIAGVLALLVVILTSNLWLSALLIAGISFWNTAGRPSSLYCQTQVAAPVRGSMMGLTMMSNQIGMMLGAAFGGVGIAMGGYLGWGIVCGIAGIASGALGAVAIRPDELAKVGAPEAKPAADALATRA